MSSQENGRVPVNIKVVGIDASLTGTGLAISNGFNLKTATERIESKLKGVDRLIEIREIVRENILYADLVVIEDYAYSRSNRAHQMGELGGVLRVLFKEMNKNLLIVGTSQLKKFATGRHNASKEEMAVGAYKKWGIECKTNDETDAAVLIEIGKMYLMYDMPIGKIKHDYALLSYQQEVIDALRGIEPPKKKRKKVAKCD